MNCSYITKPYRCLIKTNIKQSVMTTLTEINIVMISLRCVSLITCCNCIAMPFHPRHWEEPGLWIVRVSLASSGTFWFCTPLLWRGLWRLESLMMWSHLFVCVCLCFWCLRATYQCLHSVWKCSAWKCITIIENLRLGICTREWHIESSRNRNKYATEQ